MAFNDRRDFTDGDTRHVFLNDKHAYVIVHFDGGTFSLAKCPAPPDTKSGIDWRWAHVQIDRNDDRPAVLDSRLDYSWPDGVERIGTKPIPNIDRLDHVAILLGVTR